MVGGGRAWDGDDVMNAIREEGQVKEVNIVCTSDCRSEQTASVLI